MTVSTTFGRSLQPELMDAALPLPETERALADLDRVHARLFGDHAARRALSQRIAAGSRCQTLIDLGTGSGRISSRLKQRALRRGVALRVIGVDRKLAHLVFGARSGHEQLRIVADADALPFRAGCSDWSFSNLLFHHFSESRNRVILQEMQRVARRAAVVVDLRRALCARIFVRVLLPLLRVGHVARYDGKLSTDQAWCLAEIRQLTTDLPVTELRRRFPFRFSLVLEHAPASSAQGNDATTVSGPDRTGPATGRIRPPR